MSPSNTEPLSWAGALSSTWDILTANWTNSAGASAVYTELNGVGNQVLFEDTKSPAGTSVTVDLGANSWSPANVTIDNTSKEYVITGAGGIAGGTSLIKKGSNRATLMSTAHAYTGGTLVQGGTLALGNGATDGMVQGSIDIATGLSLVVSNVSPQQLNGPITGAGTLIKGSAGTLTLNLSSATTATGGMSVYDGTAYSINIGTEMTGPVLVEGANAKLQLTTSAYIGGTGVGAGTVTLNNGGTLQNDENTAVANAFLTANRDISIGAGGGTFNLPGATPAILGYQGAITGTGTLTKDGPGELRVYNNSGNTFTKLVINAGWYTAGHGTGLTYNNSYGVAPGVPTADSITIRNGSIMRLAGAAPGVTLSSNQGITMGAGGGIIRVVGGVTLVIPGVITGSGALQLNSAVDNGVLTLSGANDHSGGMNLIKGTLNIDNATALGAAGNTFSINPWLTNLVTINNTSGGAITLTANNPQNWWANFTFAGTNDLNLGAGAVTLNASITLTTSTAGTNLTVGGAIAGTGFGLTKAGAGTLTLAGAAANTYDGGTTVNVGTLDVQKDGGLGSGNVTVASGATLKLTGGTLHTFINSGATLTLNGASPAVNLDYTGTPNTINALYFGATQQAAGTWGAIGSGAAHQSAFFTGTGILLVTYGRRFACNHVRNRHWSWQPDDLELLGWRGFGVHPGPDQQGRRTAVELDARADEYQHPGHLHHHPGR